MSGQRRTRRPNYSDGALGLVLAIVEGSANLRGARCVEFPAEFDPDRRASDLGFDSEVERWEHVTVVCRACPARAACWEWASGIPPAARPRGALATSVINPYPVIHSHRDRADAIRKARTDPDSPEDADTSPDQAAAS